MLTGSGQDHALCANLLGIPRHHLLAQPHDLLHQLHPHAPRHHHLQIRQFLGHRQHHQLPARQFFADQHRRQRANPEAIAQLTPVTDAKPVTPEKVKAVEVGYKGLLGDRLLFDLVYYHNSYDNFITQVILRQSAGPLDLTATAPTEQNIRNASTLLTPGTDENGRQNSYSAYTNLSKTVTAQGAAVGLEYSLPRGYKVGGNYNWNKLNEELGDGYLSEFNTPQHKFNLTFGNRKVTEKIGFNVAYRWQSSFLWEATFAQGEVPAVGLMDAQVSYKVKAMKSTFKLGGSDIFNKRYVLNYGAPTIGAIYYISVTFDQMFNK